MHALLAVSVLLSLNHITREDIYSYRVPAGGWKLHGTLHFNFVSKTVVRYSGG